MKRPMLDTISNNLRSNARRVAQPERDFGWLRDNYEVVQWEAQEDWRLHPARTGTCLNSLGGSTPSASALQKGKRNERI